MTGAGPDDALGRLAPPAGGAAPAWPAPADVRVTGAAILYRLFDVGYEIRLDRALDLLSASAPERVKPVRGEAQAIQIKNTPVTVILGTESVLLGGVAHDVEVSARLFDFGVASLRLRIAAPPGCTWPGYVAFATSLHAAPALGPVFEQHLRLLLDRIGPAIERRAVARVTEDYTVFRVDRLADASGARLAPDALPERDLVGLLLGERRELAPAAQRELLPHRFAYYADDLAVLTWNTALVVEPTAEDTDVQYVLEFANAQLLELRVYDALLDDELPRMYARIATARRGANLLSRRFAPVLTELQTLVADITELVERVENSLKVTDDVYLARIYSAALEIFRGREWRRGVDRKLEIIHETYEMLNGESQSARMELLEAAIVLLIVFEIVMSFVRR
jgi:hypothetical protein